MSAVTVERIATSVSPREGAFLLAVVLGVLVWAGIYFRDERLGSLLPLRKSAQ